MPAVRMKDIARDLGVSAVTVSKVLRGHPDIGQATTDRVLARVRELKYRPNLMARSLVTGRSSMIAFVVPDLVHGFFAEIAVTVSTELRRHGYSMLIAWTADDPEVQSDEIEHLLSIGIDAMIVATVGEDVSGFELLTQRGVPFVLLDREMPALKAAFVGSDDILAGRMATDHLIQQGCKRIAHIGGPAISPGQHRLEGYRLALKEAGRKVNEHYLVTATEDDTRGFQQGFEATKRLLRVTPRIDGIFCFNDPLAVGAMEAVFAAGLRVPEDIAIIGCGNHPLGETLRLPLSTIDQDMKGLGEKSAKAVLALLAPSPKAGKKYILKPKLVVRASTQRGRGR